MTQQTEMARLDIVDADGDTISAITASVAGYLWVSCSMGHDPASSGSVHLKRQQVAELVDYMAHWLEQDADAAETHPCQLSDARNCDCPPGGCGALESDNVVPLRAVPEAEPQTILAEAESLVYGDRQGDYGHPRQDFTRTALLWTGVLMHKLAEGEHITPEDIALCMVQVKVSREVNKPKRDNRVDGAGYFLCLDRLETGK